MNEGLVTRIGKWIDNKWESKATVSELQKQSDLCKAHHFDALTATSDQKIDFVGRVAEVEAEAMKAIKAASDQITAMQENVKQIVALIPNDFDVVKEFSELKTRFERLELYSGMARKVDPTKPPVVKSAFSM